jgi:general secretion pathway protein G
MRHTVHRKAFSLIELLIVVTILGIIAMLVAPQFTSATGETRETALRDNLGKLRKQITLYRAEHNVLPGYPAGDETAVPTADVFRDQMLLFTDASGNTNDTRSGTFKFGPYLDTMPANPVTGLDTIRIVTGSSAITPDNSTGWIFQPATGRIYVNLQGNDAQGRPFLGY